MKKRTLGTMKHTKHIGPILHMECYFLMGLSFSWSLFGKKMHRKKEKDREGSVQLQKKNSLYAIFAMLVRIR